jgi:hypothetical protein
MKFSDLTEQQVQEICEAFAKMEGMTPPFKMMCGFAPCPKQFHLCYYDTTNGMTKVSDYPNSLDAMHCIIEGLKGDEPRMFIWHLHEMVGDGGMYVQTKAIVKIIKATCQQQFVAAALALGLIKEGANHE